MEKRIHWMLLAVTVVLLQTWRDDFVIGKKVGRTTKRSKGALVGVAAPKGRSIGKSSSTQTEDGSVPSAVPAIGAVANPKKSSWERVKKIHCSTVDKRTICATGSDKTNSSKQLIKHDEDSNTDIRLCPAWQFIDEEGCRILDSGCPTNNRPIPQSSKLGGNGQMTIEDARYFVTPDTTQQGFSSGAEYASYEKFQIGLDSNYSLSTFRAVNLSGTLACETWIMGTQTDSNCQVEESRCPAFVAKIQKNPSYWYEDRAVACIRNVSLLRKREPCLYREGADDLYRAAMYPTSCLGVGDFCVFDEDCGCKLTCVTNFTCQQLFTNEALAKLKDNHSFPYTWDLSKDTSGDMTLFTEKVYARVKSDRMQCRKIGTWSVERWELCLIMFETHFNETSVDDTGAKRKRRSWCATNEGCGEGLECVKFFCITYEEAAAIVIRQLCSKELDLDSRPQRCEDRGLFLWKKTGVPMDSTKCGTEGGFCIRDEDCCMYASFIDPKKDLLLCTGYPFYTCLSGIHVAMPCNVTKDVGYKSVSEEVCGHEGTADAQTEVNFGGRPSQTEANLEKLFLDFDQALTRKEERAELCKQSNIVAKFYPEPIEGDGICNSDQTEMDNRKALAIQGARIRKWCWELDPAEALICTSKLDAYMENGYLNIRRNCIPKGDFCVPSQFRGCCDGACDKVKFICGDRYQGGYCDTDNDCKSLDWRISLRPICSKGKKCLYVET